MVFERDRTESRGVKRFQVSINDVPWRHREEDGFLIAFRFGFFPVQVHLLRGLGELEAGRELHRFFETLAADRSGKCEDARVDNIRTDARDDITACVLRAATKPRKG